MRLYEQRDVLFMTGFSRNNIIIELEHDEGRVEKKIETAYRIWRSVVLLTVLNENIFAMCIESKIIRCLVQNSQFVKPLLFSRVVIV